MSKTTYSRWKAPALALLLFNIAVFLFLRPVYQSPDGVGYFAYLWSIFYEKTLSFAAVYQRYSMVMPLTRTPQGWLANNWAFGTAMLWWPFFEAGQIGRFFFGSSGEFTMRQALCLANFGSMAFGAACSGLLYAALKEWKNIPSPKWVVGLTLLGTPLFYYSFVDTTYAHAATAFASGLFLWYWLKTWQSKSGLRWGLMGLLLGIAACVRTQEILIGLAPFWEWLELLRKEPEQRPHALKLAALLAAGFVVGFSPQALAWKWLYGSYFAAPSAFNLAWSNFALWETLFSSYHGLLTWTPLFLLAIMGLIWEGRSGETRAFVLLALLISQILINSFSVAWWGGMAFGLRQLTGVSLIVGLGVGCYLKRGKLVVAILCTLWTTLLALRGYAGSLDMLLYVSPRTLASVGIEFQKAYQGLGALLTNRSTVPWELFGMWVTAEVLVGGVFWMCFKSPRWLLGCAVALVVIADVALSRAREGTPPEFSPGAYLEASQLADFFKYESYAVRALYHEKRGESAKAEQDFALAEVTLPDSPATAPWREQLKQWRSGVK